MVVDKIKAYRHWNQTTVWTIYALYCGNTFFLPWESCTYCVNNFHLLCLYDNIKGNFQHFWNAMAWERDSEIVFSLNNKRVIFILVWGVYIENMKILGSVQEVPWSCQERDFGCFQCTFALTWLNGNYWLQKILHAFSLISRVHTIIFGILECP